MTFIMKLDWKEYNVDLEALQVHLKSLYPNLDGCAAGRELSLIFFEEPSQEDKDAVVALWESIDAEHEMVASYKSQAQRIEEKMAKKESGKAKLLALGLTEDEVAALIG